MMARSLMSAAVVFVLFGGWMLIQQAGRRFAQRHPEFGRFREEGGECGKTCGCANWKTCAMKRAEGRGQKTEFRNSNNDPLLNPHGADP